MGLRTLIAMYLSEAGACLLWVLSLVIYYTTHSTIALLYSVGGAMLLTFATTALHHRLIIEELIEKLRKEIE